MNKVEIKNKIKLHLKLLAETNMYTKEMDVTTTDLYNLFRSYVQQVNRKVVIEFECFTDGIYEGTMNEKEVLKEKENIGRDFDEWYSNHQKQQ